MLHMSLDFEKNLTVDAMLYTGAFVSAIAQNDLDGKKEKAPKNVLKIDDPPNFQIQVANGQLKKPLAWIMNLETIISLNTSSLWIN